MKSYITFLRFPLALAVVMIHAHRTELLAAATADTQWWAALVSHGITRFAVPLFFVISGYLFFQGLQTWNGGRFVGKLKRRLVTLLLPFVVWNVAALLLYWLQSALPALLRGESAVDLWTYALGKGGVGIFWNAMPLGADAVNLAGWHFEGTRAPLLVPLWFMRDLMVNVLLVPATFFLLHCLRGAWVAMLAVVYYSRFYPSFFDVSMQSVFFFTFGAWVSRWKGDAGERLVPFALPALVLAVAAMWIERSSEVWPRVTALLGRANYLVGEAYVLAAMAGVVGGAKCLSRMFKPSVFLAESSFFIYAAHIIVLSPMQMAAATYMSRHATAGQLIIYFSLPILAVLICLGAYVFIKKTMPKIGIVLGV